MCLLHEPSSPAPINKIVFSEQSGLFRGAYVVANFLLPRLKSNNSGLTQALVKLGCQTIPKQVHSNSLHYEPSPRLWTCIRGLFEHCSIEGPRPLAAIRAAALESSNVHDMRNTRAAEIHSYLRLRASGCTV